MSEPTPQPGRPRLSSWSWLLTLLLAAALLLLALRGIDWNELAATLQQGRADYLALACIVLTISFLLRGIRWGVILSAERRIPPLTMFWATSAGYLGNTFLPARAGEIIRSALVGRAARISTSYVLATALTERMLDALTLVLICMVALVLMPAIPPWLAVAAQVIGIIGIIGLGVLAVAPRLEGFFNGLVQRLPLPEALRDKLAALLAQFLLGLNAVLHPRRATLFILLTVIIWLLDVVIAITVAQALGLVLTPPQALILLAALGLSSAAPSTPGYVGIYQFVAVTILPLFDWSRSAALAYILAFQAVTIVVVLLWGFIGLWRLGARRADIAAAG